MAETKELVRVSVRGGLGILVIDSGDYNTLSSAAILEIGRKFGELEANTEVKAVVFTGHPKSFFSAGADVKEILAMIKEGDRGKASDSIALLQAVYLQVENSKKSTIAAVNGYCLGGGLELALACDYRVASREAMMGLPEVDLGIIPGLGGTQRLPRVIGLKNSIRILLGGKKAMVAAKTAKEIGLVDEVVEGDFISGVKEFVGKVLARLTPSKNVPTESELKLIDEYLSDDTLKALIAEKSESGVASIVRALSEGCKMLLENALELERSLFLEQAFSPDGIEGLTAFAEKRTPKFKTVQPSAPETAPAGKHEAAVDDHAEEYAMLRQTLREFCENEIRPKVDEMEKAGNIFPELIQQMAELGLFGVPFPETYGGAGLGKTGYCIMMEELCRVHGSMAVLVGAGVGLTGGTIALFGTEAQKQKYLRDIAEGRAIGAFALTEAEAGSDVANLMSTAEKRGNKWVINGTKQFISNGDIADIIAVFAKTDRDLGANGITAFIVEKNYPGFKTTKVEHKMGIRASRTTSMEFTDMEVPEENVLGQLGQGFKIAMNALNYGRLSLAAGCIGASKRAFELAYAHASQRSQMGKKLTEFQMIQSYFARMRSDIFLMESSVYPVAAMADRGEDIRLESAIVKLTASEMSGRVIDTALQIHGGMGYMEESEISRLYRDARINPIFEGTNEIQQLLIFKEIFKSGGEI